MMDPAVPEKRFIDIHHEADKRSLLPNCSYVTLITTDSFFPGVSTLVKSIRKYCQYPICTLVTRNVTAATQARLKKICDEVIIVESITCPYKSDSDASWTDSELTKLNIWNLTQYQQIVYIDADAMVVDRCDELFSIVDSFAAAPDVFPPDRFNAGVLVIKPNHELFLDLVSNVGVLPSYDGGDTGFLNAYFSNWFQSPGRLSFGYNAQRTLYWFTHTKRPGYWNSIQPLKIIHYSSSPKPWESSMAKFSKGDLEWLWWQVFAFE